MIVYPAMDLMGGQVVRLRQGRFDEATTYPAEPADALADFAAAGAQWAHIVDLDGARTGAPVQHDLIAALAVGAKLRVQVGGGFRSADHVAAMLDAGVGRVVIGSLAVRDPGAVRRLLDRFGSDRITLAFDVRVGDGDPIVVTSGWTEASSLSLWGAAALFPDARHILLTDVGRDGMLAGPNFALLDEAMRRLSFADIQASGGISGLADLRALGTAGAIVGRALWDGCFTLQEALNAGA